MSEIQEISKGDADRESQHADGDENGATREQRPRKQQLRPQTTKMVYRPKGEAKTSQDETKEAPASRFNDEPKKERRPRREDRSPQESSQKYSNDKAFAINQRPYSKPLKSPKQNSAQNLLIDSSQRLQHQAADLVKQNQDQREPSRSRRERDPNQRAKSTMRQDREETNFEESDQNRRPRRDKSLTTTKSEREIKPRGENKKQVDRSSQPTQYKPYAPRRTYKSKYQEFMAAEWRFQKNEINITAETIIPKLPDKPLQQPNDAEYYNYSLECDEKIDGMYKELADLTLEYKAKQREMFDEQNGKGAVWRELKEHFDEQKVYSEQKRAVMSLREQADKEIQSLIVENSKLLKQCHPIYNTLEDLEKGQKILNKRIETNTLTSQKEKELIKEIAMIKNSKPFIVKRAEVQARIDELRTQQKKDSENLPTIQKMIASIKTKIDKVKGQHGQIEQTKVQYEQQLQQIEAKQTKVRAHIQVLKADKLAAKEKYYAKMVDFEVEQRLIRDVMWLTKTKEAMMERSDRQAKWKAEQEARFEQRKKLQEEREKREKLRKEQEEKYKLEQAEKQRLYEAQQLKKLEQNPYLSDIELCEQLIYYCVKTHRGHTKQDEQENQDSGEATEEAKKKMQDFLSKGKMQLYERVDESQLAQKKQTQKKRRDGPSVMYEDDNRLNLEFSVIQKFSKLQVSPPIEVDELVKSQQTLQTLRDALKLKGRIEICQNKAKLLKDDSWTQGDEFEKMKADLAAFEQSVQQKLDMIKRDKLNWATDVDEAGINIDEELDEEEIGQRFTKLRPEGGSRFDRNRGGDRGDRGDRRGRSLGRNQQPRDEPIQERETRNQEQTQVKREKFNGQSAESFPSF